jgi:ABC-2 type transport system ATP-binding protein
MEKLTESGRKHAGIFVEGLQKTYRGGKVRALDSVTLEIREGEIFGLIGPNGAGKTTFIGCLLGLLFPDRGTILIDGKLPDSFAVRRMTGYLPERLSFDRWMTGRQFVAYHHALAGGRSDSRGADVENVLARVELERDCWERPLKKYSRGMLQRLGLAQALVGRPRFLFLDEPSSGLDPVGVVALRRLLDSLRDEGVTVILNSHQLDQIERVCDRVAFLKRGAIETVEDLRRRTNAPRVVRARWMAGKGPPEAAALAGRIDGVSLLQVADSGARFSVAGDDAAFTLLQALLAAGARVTELSPDEERLERFFFAEGGGAA